MLLHQFFEPTSCTYTYLLASASNRNAVIIDPVKGQTEWYLKAIKELGLRLLSAIDAPTPTRITSRRLAYYADRTGCNSFMGKFPKAACASVRVEDGGTWDIDGINSRR